MLIKLDQVSLRASGCSARRLVSMCSVHCSGAANSVDSAISSDMRHSSWNTASDSSAGRESCISGREDIRRDNTHTITTRTKDGLFTCFFFPPNVTGYFCLVSNPGCVCSCLCSRVSRTLVYSVL